MTHTLLRLFGAAGVAAFLAINPVSAQVTGGPHVVPSEDLDARVSPYKHKLHDAFAGAEIPPAYAKAGYEPKIGAKMPEGITTAEVPKKIVEVSPDVEGYEYFTLPDGRVVLVNPQDHVIASIIE